MQRIHRALISVTDKTGLVEFARALHARGIEIISTGGTAKILKKEDIPVVEVSSFTGSPEILDGRVKSLHPKIHGGILAKRGDENHERQMRENGIEPIDMVVVNLYDFEKTIASQLRSWAPGRTKSAPGHLGTWAPGKQQNFRGSGAQALRGDFELAIENIDIGGPALIRSAAKNHEHVAVVTDPADYTSIIVEMDGHDGGISEGMRFHLAKKAFALTSRYDAAISNYLNGLDDDKRALDWPSSMAFSFELKQSLRYGENPHQKGAFYRETDPMSEPCVVNSRQIHGKELSYNNLVDVDAAIEAVKDFGSDRAAVVIVKHANPCGAAISSCSAVEAYEKALGCDPVSAFGGIIVANRPVDREAATKMAELFYEVIAAPSFSDDAVAILGKKKNLRLIEVSGLGSESAASGFSFRKVVGGMLIQDRDALREDLRQSKIITKRTPTDDEWAALDFAWRVCKHVKSNAIVFASSDRTLGIGAGQMSRVDSVRIAAEKMLSTKFAPGPLSPWAPEISSRGSGAQAPRRDGVIILASDAFFPFRDGIDLAAQAGATAIIQPGGSIRDDEVIEAADEHGMAMIFTGTRHFKH